MGNYIKAYGNYWSSEIIYALKHNAEYYLPVK